MLHFSIPKALNRFKIKGILFNHNAHFYVYHEFIANEEKSYGIIPVIKRQNQIYIIKLYFKWIFFRTCTVINLSYLEGFKVNMKDK